MKRALSLITFSVALACAAAASAQQFTKDGKRIGTRDELRACYDTKEAIEKRQSELLDRRNKLAAESKDLKAEGEELSSEVKHAEDDNLTGLRRTRLERKVKEHDSRLKDMQEKAATLESDTTAFEKQAADYKDKCTNVAFDNDDVAAVKKERDSAGKK